MNILVAGVYLNSEEYPNTFYRLARLRKDPRFSITEINFPCWVDSRKKYAGKYGGVRFVYSHVITFIRTAMALKCSDIVYIPYPSVYLSFLLSFFLRKRVLKRIMIDAFISPYDTLVNDRRVFDEKGIVAWILFRMEKYVYSKVEHIVVDTDLNAKFFARLFEVDVCKFKPCPLYTFENFDIRRQHVKRDAYKVIFVGNMIPLHGIEYIVRAAEILRYHPIEFHFYGDGQDSMVLERSLAMGSNNIRWVKEWVNHSSLCEEIADSDLCLGIFGTSNKTQRVCPYKVYLYTMLGMPTVTGRTEWFRANSNGEFILVDAGSSELLANEILNFVLRSSEEKKMVSNRSCEYYKNRLSNEIAHEKFCKILYKIFGGSGE